MIVITTPTGQIGGKVLKSLTRSQERLRVIARDPSKIPADLRGKVEVIQGTHDDAEVLSRALKGASQLFYIVPPSMQYTDGDRYYLDFAEPVLQAIEINRVQRVVHISGSGLGVDKNAGPVYSSYLVEKELESLGCALRILHCGSFMENLLRSASTIKANNSISACLPAEIKIPWVATQDIADVAVRFLLDTSWSDKSSIGVLGPEDLSYAKVAQIFGEVLHRKVDYVYVTPEARKVGMMKHGATEAVAQGLIDMYESMRRGTFNMVKRTASTSSPTSLKTWCETELKPLL